MNNSKDIILIYTDPERKDLGVLQDYSFDMCFGDSENTFECRVQKDNPAITGSIDRITEDSILYIEFTEIGGIVDKVTIDSKKSEITLSGRTWHGFLNSFVIEPKKGKAYREYQGEANSVISQIISNIGMGSWFEVSTEDSGITIPYTTVRYERTYDTIMSMLIEEDAKLVMWYQNRNGSLGKIHLQAVSRVNTGAFDDFDTSQTPFKAGKAYNKVNDLICLGQGNGKKRAVIHLYADENGGILPYKRKKARQDSDYYTDLTALSQSTDPEDIKNYQKIVARRQTGAKRYSLVYDYPSAEITTNYIKQTTKPSNWEGTYVNYFYRDATQEDKPYVQFERVYKDDYELLTNQPDDWRKKYKNYYVKEHNADTSYKKVEALTEQQGATIIYRPNTEIDGYEGMKKKPDGWKDYFETETEEDDDLYYEKVPQMSSYVWQKVEPVQEVSYELYTPDDPPFDWDTNYSNYYYEYNTGTGYDYEPVPGIQHEKYTVLTTEPYDWFSDFGGYYFKATRTVYDSEWNVKYKRGDYITVSQGISDGLLDGTHKNPWGTITFNFPAFKKKTFYVKETYETPPPYSHFYYYEQGGQPSIPCPMPFYKVTTAKAPTFVSGKYYKKYVDVVPQWRQQKEKYVGNELVEDFGGYYRRIKNVEQIPTFKKQDVYYAVQDRFATLCKDGVEKLKELSDQDSLDISLALESEYDVGDIVGSRDMDTGIDVTKQILRKIIKIKKGLLTIQYEVD